MSGDRTQRRRVSVRDVSRDDSRCTYACMYVCYVCMYVHVCTACVCERRSHDWTGSQRRVSLLSARSYIFTFQRRCTTGGGAAAARRRPVLYGCRARAGCRSANVARCAQLLHGAVLTWIRMFPVRVRRRRLLSRHAKIRALSPSEIPCAISHC